MVKFDRVAARYDLFCETPLGGFVDTVEREIIYGILSARPGQRWIDLGAGTGAHAVYLAGLGCRVTAVDESGAMLERARVKAAGAVGASGGAVSCWQGDLAALPFPDGSFEAGLLQVTLEFVDRPKAVLAEARRVIQPDGYLVIGLIHGSGPWAAHYRARGESEPASVYRGARFLTLAGLTDAMGFPPSAVSYGLFVGPTEFRNVAQARALEADRRRTAPREAAGFLAARFAFSGSLQETRLAASPAGDEKHRQSPICRRSLRIGTGDGAWRHALFHTRLG